MTAQKSIFYFLSAQNCITKRIYGTCPLTNWENRVHSCNAHMKLAARPKYIIRLTIKYFLSAGYTILGAMMQEIKLLFGNSVITALLHLGKVHTK